MTNSFVHVELNSPDPKRAKAFYTGLFQWQLEDVDDPVVPDHTYTMVKPGKGPGVGGGIMKKVPNGPEGWLAYVHVDDIRATTDKVKGLGGKFMKDVTEIPDTGRFSIIQDPTGVILGLWKPKPH